jgi:hypothetical protein
MPLHLNYFIGAYMATIEKTQNNVTFVFDVTTLCDDTMDAPWVEDEGHGIVSDWTKRPKEDGELVLNQDGASYYRYYDFKATCKKALDESWDCYPLNDGSETPKQQAAKAVISDFKRLKAWCDDEWEWVGVIVTLLDDEGKQTEISDSLFGIESDSDNYLNEVTNNLVDDLMTGYGTHWHAVKTTTYKMAD